MTQASSPSLKGGAGEVTVLDDVEVNARRGSTKILPELEYDAGQIDAQGAYDVGEVMRRAAQAFSPNEEPVVIINGVRVPNPSVYFGLPPDALERLEVLPAGSAAAFGGSPSGRVLNLVTQRRFNSRDGQVTTSTPTQGGYAQAKANLRQSRLDGLNLSNFTFSTAGSSALRAEDRPRYLEDQPGSEGVILRPANRLFSAGTTFNRGFGNWTGSLALNADSMSNRSTSRSGNRLVDLRSETNGVRIESGFSGTLMDWSVRLNLNAQANETHADGLNSSVSQGRSLRASVGLHRQFFGVAAGPISANLMANADRSVTKVRDDDMRHFSSNAGAWTAQVSIPLVSRQDTADGSLRGVGAVTLNLGVGGSQGGAGGDQSFDLGLGWQPGDAVRLNAAWRRDVRAPNDLDRFAPMRLGASTVVYDFQTGEAVEVQTVLGGNPNLRAATLETMTVNMSAGPFTPWKISVSTDFLITQTRDDVSSSLQPTPDNEAAYPDRFVRDANGRLVQVDQRPFNTSSSDAARFSTNINLLPSSGPSDGRRASIAVNLGHSLTVRDRADFGPALRAMDRLAGDGGGASPQSVSLSVTQQRGPWGVEMSGRWQEGYRSRRTIGVDGGEDLLIGAATTADLKVSYIFVNAQPGGGRGAPSRQGAGARIELSVLNVTDSRPSARLFSGRPAPGYGRDERDPVGRRIQLSLSKRF